MYYNIVHTVMSESVSRLRQQLWRLYGALARTLRALQRDAPMVQGSLYLLQRKCGKATCRCARGQLHSTWVLTRSEAGKHRLYAVPGEQRGPLRPLAREYRRWQRTRALLVKQLARLLALIDRLAQQRLQRWPPPKPHEPGTD
jgi:hypothetical protein